MTNVLRHRKAVSEGKTLGDLSEEDREAYPNLCTLLLGVPGKVSGTWEVPQYKVLIWLEGERIKACCMATDHDEKWWGTLKGLHHALDTLEKLLDEGGGEWREPKERNQSGQNGKK